MEWAQARERLRAPLFAPLHGLIERLPAADWPDHEALSALARGLRNAAGLPVRFVPPATDTPSYERHIAQTGEVPTRGRNWHDLFNALAWIAYPEAKARINAQHATILAEGGEAEARHRSPPRDALTLFDEGGVAVASDSTELLRLISAFEWKALFRERRAEVLARMRVLGFGHGFFEQALEPYIGMVAKTVFVPVEASFFRLDPEAQRAHVDRALAAHFADRANFPSPRAMAPMPVLGVPGWHLAAQDEAFYDDASYFRSKPRKGPPAR